MGTLKTLDSTIISLIILIILYLNMYNRSQKIFTSYKLYTALLLSNIVLLIVDFFAWYFNGLPGNLNMWGNIVFNYLLYALAPIAPMIWILYTHHQVYHDVKRLKKFVYLLLIPLFINLIFTTISLKTGWYFWVDANNVYHRGTYLWTLVIFSYLLLAISLAFIVRNRHVIERKLLYSMILFFIPPVLGITIQYLYYGVNYNWTGMTIALLIIYLNIQDRSLRTDYLTGAFNRRQLDNYLKYKIQNSTEKKTFSAILIDLTKFKQINDLYGHHSGDEALQESVKIIKRCIGKDDFIARFGGDEFFLILDISDHHILEHTVRQLEQATHKFNQESKKPYQINFDMGYAIYDYQMKMQLDEFYRYIDRLMYENKHNHTVT